MNNQQTMSLCMETYAIYIYISTQVERCGLDLLLLNKQGFTLTSLLQNRCIVRGQRATKQG